ncbi:MAG: ribonuclease P protein component [Bacteroidales bacterium]
MDTLSFTLPKSERLSSKNSIDLLFAQGESFVVYPFRLVYTELTAEQQSAQAAMFVSVPKKRFKRAVKRNLIRRRTKEAYRLNKQLLHTVLENQNKHLAIAFIYLDKEIRLFDNIETKMKEALSLLANKIQNKADRTD